ncbi:AraC family transcriptional regulator [Oerskovia sp. Sa1BUA8]|uniref:AraC family transcriptional regulator n=1 Tax=Oerskovia douganii TaxID=2762210 RepID=A0A9D5UDL2_9CELL|nr:helix-turn-helix domain-containing protein [Oerskovia douganii]MBE7701106.1 AraC family transcriptional regulator [Oerskovia douganii]
MRHEPGSAADGPAAPGSPGVPSTTFGVVDPAAARRAFALGRLPAPTDLADRVDWFWLVRWDLAAGESFTQTVIPHPCVNLVAEAGGFAAHGIPEGLFDRTLVGSGVVVAAKLRPGALAVPRGASVPASGVLGPGADEAGERALALAGRGDDEAAADVLARLLRERLPPDPALSQVSRVLDAVTSGELGPRARVADLARVAGTSTRSLQRLLGERLGVGPKWVLQRHRVHLAAERLAADPGQDLAALAVDVGYYDQPHLAVDFVSVTGHTPGAYARRCAESRARLLLLASS